MRHVFCCWAVLDPQGRIVFTGTDEECDEEAERANAERPGHEVVQHEEVDYF